MISVAIYLKYNVLFSKYEHEHLYLLLEKKMIISLKKIVYHLIEEEISHASRTQKVVDTNC